jgi:hypothetical protein
MDPDPDLDLDPDPGSATLNISMSVSLSVCLSVCLLTALKPDLTSHIPLICRMITLLPVTDDVEAFQPSSGGGLTPESVDVVVDAGEGSPHHRTDMSEELGLPGVLKNK